MRGYGRSLSREYIGIRKETNMKIYQEIPQFDQETQYVIQLPPVELENGDIYYGIEVKELELTETEFMI